MFAGHRCRSRLLVVERCQVAGHRTGSLLAVEQRQVAGHRTGSLLAVEQCQVADC